MKDYNETFRKFVTYDDIKSHKKSHFTFSLKNRYLEKPQGGEGGQTVFFVIKQFD